MLLLRQSGVEMLGYVSTKEAVEQSPGVWKQAGMRTLADTETDINRWADPDTFGGFVSGIFFDETSSAAVSSADLAGWKAEGSPGTTRSFVDAHYLQLFAHARTKDSAWRVATNSGGTLPQALANAADIAVILEHTYWFYDPNAAAAANVTAPAGRPANGGCAGSHWTSTPPARVYGPGPFCPWVPLWDNIEFVTVAADPTNLGTWMNPRGTALELAALVYNTPDGMDVRGAVDLARTSHLDAAGIPVACAASDTRCPGRVSFLYLTDSKPEQPCAPRSHAAPSAAPLAVPSAAPPTAPSAATLARARHVPSRPPRLPLSGGVVCRRIGASCSRPSKMVPSSPRASKGSRREGGRHGALCVTGQSLWQLLSTTARFVHVAVTNTLEGGREVGVGALKRRVTLKPVGERYREGVDFLLPYTLSSVTRRTAYTLCVCACGCATGGLPSFF